MNSSLSQSNARDKAMAIDASVSNHFCDTEFCLKNANASVGEFTTKFCVKLYYHILSHYLTFFIQRVFPHNYVPVALE